MISTRVVLWDVFVVYHLRIHRPIHRVSRDNSPRSIGQYNSILLQLHLHGVLIRLSGYPYIVLRTENHISGHPLAKTNSWSLV